MANEVKSDSVTKDRDKWVGGSDMKNVFMSRNSKVTLAYNKAHNIPEQFSSKYTDYGNLMEPVIREAMEEILGFKFPELNDLQNTDLRIRGNLDGYSKKRNTILEIKTAVPNKSFETAVNDYKYQLLTYSYLVNKCNVILAVLRNDDFKPVIDDDSLLLYNEFTYDDLLKLCNLTTESFEAGVMDFWAEVENQRKIGADVSLPVVDLKSRKYKQLLAEGNAKLAEAEKIKAEIEEEMRSQNHTTYSNAYVKVAIVEPQIQEVINEELFRETNPDDVVDAYMIEEVTETFDLELFKESNDEEIVDAYMIKEVNKSFDIDRFKELNPDDVVSKYLEEKVIRKGYTKISVIEEGKNGGSNKTKPSGKKK